MVTLLTSRANIDMQICKGDTALLLAVKQNRHPKSFVCVNYLLQLGANPNISDERGATPLFYTANKPNFTKILLKHGANVHMFDKFGRTPIFNAVYAASSGLPTFLLFLSFFSFISFHR